MYYEPWEIKAMEEYERKQMVERQLEEDRKNIKEWFVVVYEYKRYPSDDLPSAKCLGIFPSYSAAEDFCRWYRTNGRKAQYAPGIELQVARVKEERTRCLSMDLEMYLTNWFEANSPYLEICW